jgi:hypothetical protein
MACGCSKNIKWAFEFGGVTCEFDSHAAATAERRRLGATSSPLKQVRKAKA